MKKTTYLLFAIFMLFTISCEKFIEDKDISPNDPTVVTAPLLLSGIEVGTFAAYGGGVVRNASILTQHMNGVSNQSLITWANYNFKEGDVNNEWNTIYTDILINSKTLINDYGEGNPYYRGIAKVITAMSLGLLTDFWGDIPYRDALNGMEGTEESFSPAYDSQEQIIGDIQGLLTDAIENEFSKSPGDNVLIPLEDDFIFNGEIANWINTAWILKARYALRLSKREGDAAYTKALAHLANMTATDGSMDANSVHSSASNELNQWYAFQQERPNYMQMGEFFIDLLLETNDPRLPFYAAPLDDGSYVGAPLGTQLTSFSNIGPYIGSPNSSIGLVTYVEAKFIEAEANFRLGNMAEAAEAHNAAIIASVELVTGTVIPDDYLTAHASETAATIDIEKIMTQKYIALFSQAEPYADWRRTDFPKLSPNPEGYENVIPRRFPTPQDERVNNINATIVSDITSRVWWDE